MENTREAIRFGLEKAMSMLVDRAMRDAARPQHRLLIDGAGNPMFHTVRDRLGDIMRIYRAHPLPNRYRPKYDGEALRAIRAEKGVGRNHGPRSKERPNFQRYIDLVQDWMGPLRAAVTEHGSQRAAAKALGLNLSTFQRWLAKERAA